MMDFILKNEIKKLRGKVCRDVLLSFMPPYNGHQRFKGYGLLFSSLPTDFEIK
jgi:hypothetical protein